YLRNDPNWPYYAVAGGALSVATGIARIRSDNHWATDVAAGLAMGTAVGIAYPLLTRVRREARDDEDSVMFVLGPRNAELVVRF
ncbi:MAG: hypothetical protein AAFY60_14655, partial [Myxococcota bacterium]